MDTYKIIKIDTEKGHVTFDLGDGIVQTAQDLYSEDADTLKANIEAYARNYVTPVEEVKPAPEVVIELKALEGKTFDVPVIEIPVEVIPEPVIIEEVKPDEPIAPVVEEKPVEEVPPAPVEEVKPEEPVAPVAEEVKTEEVIPAPVVEETKLEEPISTPEVPETLKVEDVPPTEQIVAPVEDTKPTEEVIAPVVPVLEETQAQWTVRTVPTDLITPEMRAAGIDETTPFTTREELVAQIGEEAVAKIEAEAVDAGSVTQ